MKVRSARKSNIGRIIKIALAATLLVLAGILLPRIFHAVGSLVMTPVHAVNTWLSTSSGVFPSYVRDRAELHDEIKQLEEKLAIATSQDLTRDRLLIENDKLRNLLNVEEGKRIAAAVIARPNNLPYDVLQIDQGTDVGIKTGAPVFIGPDRFIGIVSEVADTYSFITLLTSPGFEATAFIEGANVVATIEGYGGGVARVRVPQGIALHIGDLVVLPSIDSGVFGKISYIESRPSQPEQYGYITPDISLQSLHYVAVGESPLTAKSLTDTYQRIDELIAAQLHIEGIETVLVATSSLDQSTTSSSTLP